MSNLAPGTRPAIADMRICGSSGLNRGGGHVREEMQAQLVGQAAARTYKEMGDSEPICGSILYLIQILSRAVKWRVTPASSRPQDQEAAEFVEQCMHDMRTTWTETISEILSMVQYGFSLHEIVYKRRCGQAEQKSMRSRFADGRVGWGDLPIRSQDTISRWLFDDSGDIIGAEQSAPPDYRIVRLPMHKCILFRTSARKNNPEGAALFRPAYRAWWMKKNLEAVEGIGVERDLAGLPIAWVPEELLQKQATPSEQAMLSRIEEIVKNIRQDEQAGVVMPLIYDENGRQKFDLKLMSSGGSRAFDTDKIIQRYDHRIAMTALGDFLLMGQTSSSTGSMAMHQDKTGMFGRSINAYLDIIEAQLREPVAKLIHLNSFAVSEYPRITHDNIEQIDVLKLGDYITKLSGAGFPLFPNRTLEAFLCEVAGLPKPLDSEADLDIEQAVERPAGRDAGVRDLHDETSLAPLDPNLDGASESFLGERAKDLLRPLPVRQDLPSADDPKAIVVQAVQARPKPPEEPVAAQAGVPVAVEADEGPPPDAAAVFPAAQAGVIASEGKSLAQVTLNGAQIDSALSIVQQVVANQLPRETALGMLQIAFNLSADQAELFLGPVGKGFEAASRSDTGPEAGPRP